MNHTFQTSQFDFSYIESNIESRVIGESHCHAQYEMIAVIEGDVSIMLEGRSYRLTDHQTIIIPPLLYHTVTANKQDVYRRVTVLFDVEAVPFALQTQFQEKVAELSMFSSRQADSLADVCKKENPAFYEPLAHSLMVQIFYEVIQAKPTPVPNETDEFLQKIIRYIDQHLCEKILLDDLANHTARSKSSVCHLFEEKMSISPKQYILQKKLALANKLIRDGTPSTLAAMQLGYNNYSAFFRVYRKHFRKNPSEGVPEPPHIVRAASKQS